MARTIIFRLICAMYCIISVQLAAQTLTNSPILTLQEKDQQAKIHDIATQRAAIDLNSAVLVRIDKQALRQRLRELQIDVPDPALPDTTVAATLAGYQAIETIMDNYTDDLKKIGSAVEVARRQRQTTDARGANPDNPNLDKAYQTTSNAANTLEMIDALEKLGLEEQINDRLEILMNSSDRGDRVSVDEQNMAILTYYNEIFGALEQQQQYSPLHRRLNPNGDTEQQPMNDDSPTFDNFELPDAATPPSNGEPTNSRPNRPIAPVDNTAIAPPPKIQPNRLYIQMAAWIVTPEGTRSIKIPNFDDLEQGSRLEMPANSLSLDAAQTKQVQQYKSAFAQHQISIDQVLQTCKQPYVDMINEWVADVANTHQSITALISDIKRSKLGDIRPSAEMMLNSQVQEYSNYLVFLKNKYVQKVSGGQLRNLIADAKIDVKELANRTTEFLKTRDILDTEVRVGDPMLTRRLSDVIANISRLDKRVAEVTYYVRNFNLLLPGVDANLEALIFNEQIYKLSIDELPTDAEFSLLYSGNRKQGDLVVLKIAAGHTADGDKQPKDLETRSMRLLNVPAHLDMVVNYAFARPTRNFSDFLPNGPAYSVVFKFPSRSIFYRNFIDAGVGLNFATFDFNRDGNPEIAAGTAFSCFRDYVQAGVGFNFSRNTPYWQAGLRIPIPTMGVGFNKQGSGAAAEAIQFDPPQ